MLPKEYSRPFIEPDNRWKIWKCNSHEEFINRFLIFGRFHKEVPEHILKEYRTVEYLMYYSYFYYPLYDEAFSKLSRIFEMAVDLRCEELNISFKSKTPSLALRIGELSKKYEDNNVVTQWEVGKDLRNILAHPKQHSFSGPINKEGSFHKYINLINKLFKDISFFKTQNEEIENLKQDSRQFENGLFILYSDKNYLLTGITPYSTIQCNEGLYSFWNFLPVLIDFPQTMDDFKVTKLLSYKLKDVVIHDSTFEGINLETNKKILISPTFEPTNIAAAERFKLRNDSSNKDVQAFCLMDMNYQMSVEIARFEYDYFWK